MAETALVFQNLNLPSWVFLKFQERRFVVLQGSTWQEFMGDSLGR